MNSVYEQRWFVEKNINDGKFNDISKHYPEPF